MAQNITMINFKILKIIRIEYKLTRVKYAHGISILSKM